MSGICGLICQDAEVADLSEQFQKMLSDHPGFDSAHVGPQGIFADEARFDRGDFPPSCRSGSRILGHNSGPSGAVTDAVQCGSMQRPAGSRA